ncbi:unnamed protein product [Camellia sinensis]
MLKSAAEDEKRLCCSDLRQRMWWWRIDGLRPNRAAVAILTAVVAGVLRGERGAAVSEGERDDGVVIRGGGGEM